LRAHVDLAERLAGSDTQAGAARLWAGDAGEAAAEFVAELARASADFPAIDGRTYPGFLAACFGGRVVRARYGRHPRLAILGLLEARLIQADVMILGGLNEGTWPPEPPADPWLSRPMRKAFGLPAPERRIGLSAHDFAQACAAPQIVLTRSTRVEGTPTVPSRWLLRLDTVLAAAGAKQKIAPPADLVFWRQSLDRVKPLPGASAPAPRPPVSARPNRLSVTEIETWRRDPYAIYARHILGLKALDPIDADPGAAERGIFIHAALAEFVRRYRDALPADPESRLIEIGLRHFGAALARPTVWAFWWPRFIAVARWFVANERTRRAHARPLVTEGSGELVIERPGGPFTLRARADRIDRLDDQTLAIIDYKTGSLPDKRDVLLGFSPQLPLEAAMARTGGFAGVAAAPVSQLRYWRLSGGDPPGEELALDQAKLRGNEPFPDSVTLADAALAGLERLIDRFRDPATPYRARPWPDYAPRYSDYVHLARVKEWSAAGDDE
jgi:ATP-dependent helicase/nuclease subunit B